MVCENFLGKFCQFSLRSNPLNVTFFVEHFTISLKIKKKKIVNQSFSIHTWAYYLSRIEEKE